MANNAAKFHTQKNVTTIFRHVGVEETRTLNGFTVTLYRWMLYTATEYAYRPTGKRRENGKKIHVNLPLNHVSDILIAQVSKKSTVKYMISLIAKLRMYTLGTVRMSLLHMIMIRRTTLAVVPNIKENTYTGSWYCFKHSISYSYHVSTVSGYTFFL